MDPLVAQDGPLGALVAFFAENTLPWRAIATAGPLSFAWAWAWLSLAGTLKRRRGWRTGYTRKVFHFSVFGTAAALEATLGTPHVCLFAGMGLLVVAIAVLRGDGDLRYEALAREQDAPHRTLYIVVPTFATVVGGLASNVLFGPVALVGYLVAGLGDAVGEPVGTRFGRHRYRVPSLRSVPTTRSLEGSSAVLVVATLACAAAFWMSPALGLSARALGLVLLIGVTSAVVEGLSPHGWDNALLQVVPAWMAWGQSG